MKEKRQHPKKKKESLNESSLFSIINPKNLKIELHQCGVDFSVTGYVKFMAACFAGLLAFAYVFQIKLQFTIPIVILAILLLPSVFFIQYKNMYEQKKFQDITAYMEQILYSFKRQPKILTALQDTLTLFQNKEDEQLRIAIGKAIQHIQTGMSKENIYEEAFSFIEEKYGCKRLNKIHKFMTKVETAGGECGESIEILLMDRNLWIDRIYDLMREKQKLRVNIAIGIGLSLLIVGFSIYMIPADFGITDKFASQIVTMAVLMLDFALWYWLQKSLSGSLLSADNDAPFEQIQRAYTFVMHADYKKFKKKYLFISLAMLVLSVFSISTLGYRIAAFLCAFAIILYTQPKRKMKFCKKRVIREVEKAFPEWLLGLSLQMQTDNVHVSISKTIADAPEILREELLRFQDGIEKYPNELHPYVDFMHDFYIADITSAMKMLYAMAEFGAESAQEQIRTLVERNTKIMDKAEKLKMEDQIAGLSFAMLLPMITGVFAMITDLSLVMFFILDKVNV